MIDLHVHSTRSDGTLSPSELVDLGIKKGLTAMALTDHDTVDGLDEIIAYANKQKESGLSVPEVIPGIEFSTEFDSKEVHIVGLFIDYKCEAFTTYLKHFTDERDNRNKRMCKKFLDAGFDVKYEDLIEEFPGAVITRAHIARHLVVKGYVKSNREAFDRYIGDHAPFYEPREKVTPEMAIDLILKANGIPVFAHPILCHLSSANLDALVKSLKEAGLMGIEAVYSTYTSSDERQIRELAQKYHLLSSGGSDFHGSNKEDIDLGTGRGHLYVDDSLLSAMKERRKNLLFTDMDGTLLLNSSEISENMKAALDRMTGDGHKLILTSGRPLPSILERKDKLGLNFSNSYVISNNGACIYDCEKEEIINRTRISQNILRGVVDIVLSHQVHVHSYTDTEILGLCEDEEIKFYRSKVYMPFVKVKDIAASLPDGAYKVQIIHLTDHDILEKIRKEIVDKFDEYVDVMFSSKKYLEVLPKNVNKGSALLWLTSYLSFPISHTFASGDEENDISMVKAAGTGVAMKNAIEALKMAADIVTENDNDHDGLIQIIDLIMK